MAVRIRESTVRCVGLFSVVTVFVFICTYDDGSYGDIAGPSTSFSAPLSFAEYQRMQEAQTAPPPSQRDEDEFWSADLGRISTNTCPLLLEAKANIVTVEEFSKLEFQPSWLRNREYWDDSFEERYLQYRNQRSRWPLKVIIVPHSHNDPGWLKTFEGYYHSQTRNILNHMVNKLPVLTNMTFIWSEISFLSLWWESAPASKKRILQQLLDDGRLEIVTGGWVMADEATTHIYALLDQLIEGHQWIRDNLDVPVRSGWSVDPFGHGSTLPYLLRTSGVTMGTVIQRIHYAWKQWFAKQISGDFLWRQNWDSTGRTDMLVHNLPFDIYSIKHSCGPHPHVCLSFDFRRIPDEYGAFISPAVPINQQNIKQKADTLMEQYERTGSLFPHNVLLVPLGDDFRYDYEIEWDQQYKNYKLLMDFINERKEVYHADIQFGTPEDYFREIRNRVDEFATLKGDFYVYSDVFSEGRPAYWSGFYTTRPYWKLLDRELEKNLRASEILYTFCLNMAKQRSHNETLQVLARNYERLVRARRNLALFQHHDAITGTSKAFVMKDYASKMAEGIQDSLFLQTFIVQKLLLASNSLVSYNVVAPESKYESDGTISPKLSLFVSHTERRIVVFNSLGQYRQEVIVLHVNTPYVKVTDWAGNLIIHQINPLWNLTVDKEGVRSSPNSKVMEISSTRFELLFLTELAPLSLNVFIISDDETQSSFPLATIYCQHCRQSVNVFQLARSQPGDIQLENNKLRVLFNGKSGFLRSITKKDTQKQTFCSMIISAYQSAQFHSGAYLFMPDPNSPEVDRDFLLASEGGHIKIITSGPITSELAVVKENYLTHTARLYHGESPLSEGIYMENSVDFGAPPENRDVEMFMRFASTINNGDPSVFYTDANGMQMQKRVTVDRIGIEGNYYPITTGMYIEDDEQRLSLLVDHSQGASSWQPGWMEVMVDRRTSYDDARGVGEGVVDNKKILAKYWLLLEDRTRHTRETSKPSLLFNYLSNGLLYPPSLYQVEEAFTGEPSPPRAHDPTNRPVYLISQSLPCDVHLMTLRTNTDPTYSQFPSSSSLLVLHRQGFACEVGTKITIPGCFLDSSHKHLAFRPDTRFKDLRVNGITKTSLTGVYRERDYTTLDKVHVFPMEIITLNISFA